MSKLLPFPVAAALLVLLVAGCASSESAEDAWTKEAGALSEQFTRVVESMAAKSEGLRSRADGERMFSSLTTRAEKLIGKLKALETPSECERLAEHSLDSWRQFAGFAKEMSHQPGLDVKEYAARMHANETVVLQSLSDTLDEAGANHC